MAGKSNVLTFLHFNDVYEVESVDRLEVCGGAARFSTVINKLKHLSPLFFFGGDCFSPSLLSNFTQGKHMVDVLNYLKVDCAVVGNHDFDFGVEELEDLSRQCNFPWLLSNVFDKETEEPLSHCKTFHVFEKNGRKIGVVGLVEEEWLATVPCISMEDVEYLDFIHVGKKLAQELKNQGCDFIIALTHMRWPNSEKIAQSIDQIDLVLSGHDHFYRSEKINGKFVVVSGCEFRQLTKVTVTFTDNGHSVETEQIDVTMDIQPNEELAQIIYKYTEEVNKQMDAVLGRIKTDLDGRFCVIRSQETSLGNFFCDITLSAVDPDVVLMNSGTFRSDRIHPAGPFTHRDLRQILPYLDPMVVLSVTGKQLYAALENSVSQYPKLEGRFPQVAGIRFSFDSSKPAYNRVDMDSVYIGTEKLNLDKKYRVCTKAYLAQGNDGYTVFKDADVVIDVDNAPVLSILVQNFFTSIQVIQGFKKRKSICHHQSIISLKSPKRSREPSVDVSSASDRWKMLRRQSTLEDLEIFHVMAPAVEGRITNTNATNENILETLKIN